MEAVHREQSLWDPSALLSGFATGQEEKGAAEDEMVGWHHQLNGHEFEQTLGDGEGQGGLACCSPWGRKESGTTGWLDNNNFINVLNAYSRSHLDWNFLCGIFFYILIKFF